MGNHEGIFGALITRLVGIADPVQGVAWRIGMRQPREVARHVFIIHATRNLACIFGTRRAHQEALRPEFK